MSSSVQSKVKLSWDQNCTFLPTHLTRTHVGTHATHSCTPARSLARPLGSSEHARLALPAFRFASPSTEARVTVAAAVLPDKVVRPNKNGWFSIGIFASWSAFPSSPSGRCSFGPSECLKRVEATGCFTFGRSVLLAAIAAPCFPSAHPKVVRLMAAWHTFTSLLLQFGFPARAVPLGLRSSVCAPPPPRATSLEPDCRAFSSPRRVRRLLVVLLTWSVLCLLPLSLFPVSLSVPRCSLGSTLQTLRSPPRFSNNQSCRISVLYPHPSPHPSLVEATLPLRHLLPLLRHPSDPL